MSDLHQQLMDQAYDRWKASGSKWSKEQFYDSLNAQERFAVHTDNFNYQVCNGGFMQWWYNKYGTPATVEYLLRAMERMNTETAKAVTELLKRYKKAVGTTDPRKHHDEEAWDEIMAEMDGLDRAFYDINEQFLLDCEAHLQKGEW